MKIDRISLLMKNIFRMHENELIVGIEFCGCPGTLVIIICRGLLNSKRQPNDFIGRSQGQSPFSQPEGAAAPMPLIG